jgi:hypothetical protein
VHLVHIKDLTDYKERLFSDIEAHEKANYSLERFNIDIAEYGYSYDVEFEVDDALDLAERIQV